MTEIEASGRRYAFVGGWSRRNSKSLSLLLGVRKGRQRKLIYIGEAKVDPQSPFVSLLERRLRKGEVDASPFVGDIPADADSAYHWVAPQLVAEITFEGWTKARRISHPHLHTLIEHKAFKRPAWVEIPDT